MFLLAPTLQPLFSCPTIYIYYIYIIHKIHMIHKVYILYIYIIYIYILYILYIYIIYILYIYIYIYIYTYICKHVCMYVCIRVLTRHFGKMTFLRHLEKSVRLKAYPRTLRRIKRSWGSGGFLLRAFCLGRISMNAFFRTFSTC